jgi:hypothetical protein
MYHIYAVIKLILVVHVMSRSSTKLLTKISTIIASGGLILSFTTVANARYYNSQTFITNHGITSRMREVMPREVMPLDFEIDHERVVAELPLYNHLPTHIYQTTIRIGKGYLNTKDVTLTIGDITTRVNHYDKPTASIDAYFDNIYATNNGRTLIIPANELAYTTINVTYLPTQNGQYAKILHNFNTGNYEIPITATTRGSINPITKILKLELVKPNALQRTVAIEPMTSQRTIIIEPATRVPVNTNSVITVVRHRAATAAVLGGIVGATIVRDKQHHRDSELRKTQHMLHEERQKTMSYRRNNQEIRTNKSHNDNSSCMATTSSR